MIYTHLWGCFPRLFIFLSSASTPLYTWLIWEHSSRVYFFCLLDLGRVTWWCLIVGGMIGHVRLQGWSDDQIYREGYMGNIDHRPRRSVCLLYLCFIYISKISLTIDYTFHDWSLILLSCTKTGNLCYACKRLLSSSCKPQGANAQSAGQVVRWTGGDKMNVQAFTTQSANHKTE